MFKRLLFPAMLIVFLTVSPGIAQQVPEGGGAARGYASYDELFDDFDARRQVLVTKWDRLQEKQNVAPEEVESVEEDLKALDSRYADALRRYIDGHPEATDLMPARYERTIALSRLDSRLEAAVEAADEFLKHHEDSELAPDVLFLKGQTLFQIEGREEQAITAFDQFISKYPDRRDSDAARMMKIRTMLFVNRVEDARDDLETLLDKEEVKEDEEAFAYLSTQLENLEWIGRELPEFARPDVKGQLVKKANLTGKPSLLFFWDSTSGACLGELPFVREAVSRFKDDMNFLGVSVNESKPAFEQWLNRNEEAVKFTNLWIDRDEENSLVKKLDVTLIPFLVLLDKRGRIYRYDVRSDDMLRYASKLAGE